MAMAGDYLTIQSGAGASGYCSGNYTVCVELGQDGKDDLCQGLEQNNEEFYLGSERDDMEWFCSQESLPCHEQESESCPVESWCLSPNVFAASLGGVDGDCSDLPDIQCSSVSSATVWDLLDLGGANNSTAHAAALSCLVDRCSMYSIDALANDDPPTSIVDIAGYGAALLGAFVAAALFLYRTYREPSDSETVVGPLTTKDLSSSSLAAGFEIRPNEGAIGSETSYVLEETTGDAATTTVPPLAVSVGTDFIRMLISAVVVLVRQSVPVADRAPLALPQSDPHIQLCQIPESRSGEQQVQ
jgi:hypothetical protein